MNYLNIKNRYLVFAFAVIAMIIARGSGFVRELLLASTFGTSNVGDAFIVAYSIPEILVNAFTYALAALYVPMFHRMKNKEEAASYNFFLCKILLILSVVLVIFIEMFPGLVVSTFASGFNLETKKITVYLLRFIGFSVIPISFMGFFTAVSQVVNNYHTVTLLSVITNITVIIALLFYNSNYLEILGISVVLGNVIYTIISYILLRNKGFVVTSSIKVEVNYVKLTLTGVIPILITSVIEEINQVVDKNFGSQLAEGTISALNYSQKLINLTTAVLGTTITNLLFSEISRIAANKNDYLMSKKTEKITLLMLGITIPICIIFLCDSNYIISLIFGRGKFNNDSVKLTAECLSAYAVGVLGFNIRAVWTRIFNASINTKDLVFNSIIAVVLNITLNILLMPALKHVGLALATCIVSITTDVLLIIRYKNINKTFKPFELIFEMCKVVLCAVPPLIILLYANMCMKVTSVYAQVLVIILHFIVAIGGMVIVLVLFKTRLGEILKEEIFLR